MIFEVIIILVIVVIAAIIINGVQDYDRKKVEMSFKESMNLTDLPVVTFYNGSTKLNFLLDTGANMCIINSRIIDSLNYKKLDEKGSVFGMEGNSVDIDYISMDFTYNNKSYSSSFQVVDMQEAFDRIKQASGVIVHGILGSKFFEEYKYVLDFKELIAYTK
jgi:flagellar basal body rod protein FlgB